MGVLAFVLREEYSKSIYPDNPFNVTSVIFRLSTVLRTERDSTNNDISPSLCS